MPPVLLAALSLDGSWRTPEADPRALLRALGVRGTVWTDIPAFRRRRVPGLRWAAREEIMAEARKGRSLILGTPGLHAALLERGPAAVALVWMPQVALGGERAVLAAPFVPPDGLRARFRLRRVVATPLGLACHYAPVAPVRSPGRQKALRR